MAETCSRCGDEVRWGWRDGREAFWHRESVDHEPLFGRSATPEMIAERDRQYFDVQRVMDDGTVYTTAEFEASKDKDVDRRNRRLAFLRGEDPDHVEPLPPVEQHATDVDPSTYPPRSGIKQVINLILKSGWDLVSVQHSRGPYLGADGSCLSISDSDVVRGRGPKQVDGTTPIAVGSWRDGGFNFAFTGSIKDGTLTTHSASSAEMKAWIKEN